MLRNLTLCAAVLMACGSNEETPPAPTPAPTPAAETPAPTEATGAAPTKAPEAEAEPTFEEQVAASQPLSPTPADQTTAGLTVHATRCTFEGDVQFLSDSSSRNIGRIEVDDAGRLYLVDPAYDLRRFTVAGEGDTCTLTADASFGTAGVLDLQRDIKEISWASGKLYASSGIFDSYRLTDGAVDVTCSQRARYLVMAPDGRSGFGTFANSPIARVTFSDTGCEAADWADFQSPFNNHNVLAFLGRDIAIGGVLSEQVEGSNPRVVAVFDANGREKLRFGKTDREHTPDRFGWVHAIEACGPGICVLDSNYRRLTIWDARSGEFKGHVELKDLFDLRYAWFPDFEITGGRRGVAYFTAAQERGDSDVYEGLVFRVTGLN